LHVVITNNKQRRHRY